MKRPSVRLTLCLLVGWLCVLAPAALAQFRNSVELPVDGGGTSIVDLPGGTLAPVEDLPIELEIRSQLLLKVDDKPFLFTGSGAILDAAELDLTAGRHTVVEEPPRVLTPQLFPERQNRHVPVTSSVQILFSEPIRLPMGGGASVHVEDEMGQPIEGSVEVSETQVTSPPREPFQEAQSISVTITTVVTDEAGNTLPSVFRDQWRAPTEAPETRLIREFLNEHAVPIGNTDIPTESRLLPNYPNPFNPETWIPYELEQEASVIIRIYDLRGRLVRQLDLGRRSPGRYLDRRRAARWDGRDSAGQRLASGLYVYRIHAGDFQAERRMILGK